MRFDIFTLFPAYFEGPFQSSILKRAQANGSIALAVHDIRDWAEGRHRQCDDYPFGGGAGMVLKPEPVAAAVESVLEFKSGENEPPCPVVIMSPQGRTFSQEVAWEMAQLPRVAIVCGHYEGIDE